MRNAIRGLISPGERYIKENKIKDICEDGGGKGAHKEEKSFFFLRILLCSIYLNRRKSCEGSEASNQK